MSTHNRVQPLHCNNGAAINNQKSSGGKANLDTSNANLNQQTQQIRGESMKKGNDHLFVERPDQIDLK